MGHFDIDCTEGDVEEEEMGVVLIDHKGKK
jgi:hypothetical protein